MTKEERIKEARRILRHTIEGIEFYQVAESLDAGTTEEDVEEILDLIDSARIEVGP